MLIKILKSVWVQILEGEGEEVCPPLPWLSGSPWAFLQSETECLGEQLWGQGGVAYSQDSLGSVSLPSTLQHQNRPF